MVTRAGSCAWVASGVNAKHIDSAAMRSSRHMDRSPWIVIEPLETGRAGGALGKHELFLKDGKCPILQAVAHTRQRGGRMGPGVGAHAGAARLQVGGWTVEPSLNQLSAGAKAVKL